MSCLFDSMSFFLENVSSPTLRQMIVDFLRQNPVFVEGMSLKRLIQQEYPIWDVEEYLSHMEKPSSWGGAIEIRAFCELFGIHVRVHDLRYPNTKYDFHPSCDSSQDVWIELMYTGNHYTPK